MSDKSVFKTTKAMHETENKLVEKVKLSNLRYQSSEKLNELAFNSQWNLLLEFWREKKQLAVRGVLP